MASTTVHRSHAAVAVRLRRAQGHLQKIITMIGEERPCVVLAQQLLAVESAVSRARKELIHDHIDHCLEEAAGSCRRKGRGVGGEFKEIARYL